MKASKRNRLIGLALTGSFGLLGATEVLAVAGDFISNRATLSYDVGTVTQPVIESSDIGNTTPGVGNGGDTVFREDRIINFTVTRGSTTGAAVPGGTLQAVEYTVLNNGNATQDFLLKGLNNADGTADPFLGTNDEFDATLVQTFVEDGTTAGFQPAEDTAAFVSSLAPTATQTVYVVSTIPLDDSGGNPLVNTNVAVMTLVAQVAEAGGTGDGTGAIMADDNGWVSPGGTGFSNGAATLTTVAGASIADTAANVETVFNDPSGTLNGTGAADTGRNGQHSDDSSYTINSAALTVSKTSSTLWDAINLDSDPKAIPGAYVRYTITVSNAAGAATATLTEISDVLSLALMDPVLSNGGLGNAIFAGSTGNNVRIVDGAGTQTFCLADNADTNGDGCTYNGALGDTLTVDLGTAAGTATLNASESLTVEFNVIIQ